MEHTWIGWDWRGKRVISIWYRIDGRGLGMDFGATLWITVITFLVHDTNL